MAWNDQLSSSQQGMPPAMPGQSPGSGYPGYLANNPLQPQQPPVQGQGVPQQGAGPGMVQPLPVPPAAPQPVPGTGPALAVPAAAGAQLNDDGVVAADDITWINRARRVINETQGDPYRQIQLLQHVRAQYIKQRFGRSVHTDEG